jgi:hypothetical protein
MYSIIPHTKPDGMCICWIRIIVQRFTTLNDALRDTLSEHIWTVYIQVRSLGVERLLCVNLEENPPGIQKYLPQMIYAPSPIVEGSDDVQAAG